MDVHFFVFFKQKTAYEMRISDWSSDVCSSDLPSPLVESAAMAAVALPAPSYRPLLPKRVLDDNILSAAQLETVVHALAATEIEIGRASCRERVCQYV